MLICSNCRTPFPKGTKLEVTLWACSGQCYLNWFRRHFPHLLSGGAHEKSHPLLPRAEVGGIVEVSGSVESNNGTFVVDKVTRED